MLAKIFWFTKYSREGASSRLRSYQFFPLFLKDGFNIEVSELFDGKYLANLYNSGSRSPVHIFRRYISRLLVLPQALRCDLIWIEKELFPYFPPVFEFFFKILKKKYIVDYDDAIFHTYDLSKYFLVRKFLGKKIDFIMRNAECVVVGNSYLAQRAISAGAKKVYIIPTVVDVSRYKNSLRGNREVVIGWIGSPATQKYLLEISAVLSQVCLEFHAKLLIIGATDNVKEHFSGVDINVAKWAEDTEADLLAEISIGIMPLPDGPWENGKCGYKLIQYMASGAPVVASPVGVNVDIVTQSNCGYLAKSTTDWYSALSKLLDNQLEADAMGQAGYHMVFSKYNLNFQYGSLKEVVKAILVH